MHKIADTKRLIDVTNGSTAQNNSYAQTKSQRHLKHDLHLPMIACSSHAIENYILYNLSFLIILSRLHLENAKSHLCTIFHNLVK
jgi:hypothetical protein